MPEHLRHHALFLLLTFILHHFTLLLTSANPNNPPILNQASNLPETNDAVSSFQPSLAVVLGVLSVMFSLTFFLLLYARCCSRNTTTTTSSSRPRRRAIFNSANNQSPGIDKKLIKSLPVFRFGSLRGSKDGLECAVCLSRFEEVEILRLLPKCKHAFHIDCVDLWLENHSTCPLCRWKLTAEDIVAASNQMNHSSRVFLFDDVNSDRQSGRLVSDERNDNTNTQLVLDSVNTMDSNLNSLELFVEREVEDEEDDHLTNNSSNRVISRSSSSIVNLGISLRRILGGGGGGVTTTHDEQRKTTYQISSTATTTTTTTNLHKHNHKIVVSDVVLKNRWSNVTSSDLMFLNSEMLSARFYTTTTEDQSLSPPTTADEVRSLQMERGEEFRRIKEEIGRKRWFELRTGGELAKGRDSNASTTHLLSPAGGSSSVGGDVTPAVVAGRRSVSEITVFSRDFGYYNKGRECSDGGGRVVEEAEQKRKLWFPIAKRTVEWFANREKHSNHHPELRNV